MDRLKKAREERVEKENKFEALANKAKENALGAEETASLSTLETELQALDSEIKVLEAAEKRAGEIAARKAAIKPTIPGAPQDDASEIKEMNKISRRVSLAKAMQDIHTSRNPNFQHQGAEAEIFQEAREEAKKAGIALAGNMPIPSKFVQFTKKSLLDVATEGTDAVFTEFGGLIPILRPNPVLSQLGATFLTGLQGNVQWPRHNGDVALAFETESSNVDETTPTLNNISVSPKRFGGYVDVTDQFIIQAPWVVEPWLRGALETRYAITVDTQGLVADGTSNQCTGLMNYSGVNTVSLGSSGGDMTYPALLEFLRSTKAANARIGSTGWVTNANGEFSLARTPMQAGGLEGNFIYKPDIGTLIGRRFLTTEIIPSTFSEGGQSDLVGIAYGSRWESLLICIWGGLDILFDPYTQALGGKKRFVVNAFMDVEVEQPLEFAVCTDWDATDLPAIT